MSVEMRSKAPREPAVIVRELSRSFNGNRALTSIDVEVKAGEIFGFIGPDGAGKTTLFRILTTLLKPDSGQATVLGLDVVRDYRRLRRRLGYMPGRFSLYPDLSVRENLAFFATVFGTTIEAQYDAIAPVYRQIERFEDRRASDLSGGMKQKLALSCALVHRPDLLVLDEPTTGVDAVSRREFWDLLADLREGGLTILVSTPYMDEAARCDRVALIDEGSLLEIDSPAAIGRGYEHALVSVRGPDRVALLQVLREQSEALSVYPFGDVLHYTDRRGPAESARVVDDLERLLRASSLEYESIEPIDAGIEDVFMQRMGENRGAG